MVPVNRARNAPSGPSRLFGSFIDDDIKFITNNTSTVKWFLESVIVAPPNAFALASSFLSLSSTS